MDIYDTISHALGLEQSYLLTILIEEEFELYKKQFSLGVKDEKKSRIISELWKDPDYRAKQETANAKRSAAKKGKQFPFMPAEVKSAAATKANTKRWSDDINKKAQSDKFKQLYSDPSFKAKYKATCPHCGLTGHKGAMSRHHFDKCKKS